MKSKASWEELFDSIDFIKTNSGKITDWHISQSGTWSKDIRRLTIEISMLDEAFDKKAND